MNKIYNSRHNFILALFILGMLILITRAVYLQLLNNDFLQSHGDARSIRTIDISAHRGVITDRNGEYLAISTPVDSIWAKPSKVLQTPKESFSALAKSLELSEDYIKTSLQSRINREFVYLKRRVDPDMTRKVMALKIPDVNIQREYKRYYPASEFASHLIGFTDVDDQGQEGIELAYNKWLSGESGSKRVLINRLSQIVEDIESIKPSKNGKALILSVDRRIQYLAYSELTKAVKQHKALSGSLVMLNVKTGEVVAMVGQPSYNPNDKSGLTTHAYRNRVATDVFEPGSTIKPFIVALALESKTWSADQVVDTSPGYFKVDKHTVKDIRNYGMLDVAAILKKSSNVGMSKIVLSLAPKQVWQILSAFGFGQTTASGFPGESSGQLSLYSGWSDVELATLSYGYGLSVSALQLARAYATIANGGVSQPVSFIKQNSPDNAMSQQVISKHTSDEIMAMLENVVSADGTGKNAMIEGYRIAGKTGTARKISEHGYTEDLYVALFAGIFPASQPIYVIVVMLDEPSNGQYYGGLVAAPVFAKVAEGALRILNIPYDDLKSLDPNKIVLSQYKTAHKLTGKAL